MATKNIFQSPRLTYRAVDPDLDLPLFKAINNDPIGYANSNGSNIHLPAPNDAANWINKKSDSLLNAVICLSGSETSSSIPIGHMTLSSVPQRLAHHRFTEMSLDILPEYQRKGYGGEAIAWALDYAFRSAGMHRVCIRAFEYNDGAVRLYKKMGFVVEGVMREEIWWDGRFWDSTSLAMLDREWPDARKELEGKGIPLRTLV